jgi:hypothetical protein
MMRKTRNRLLFIYSCGQNIQFLQNVFHILYTSTKINKNEITVNVLANPLDVRFNIPSPCEIYTNQIIVLLVTNSRFENKKCLSKHSHEPRIS